MWYIIDSILEFLGTFIFACIIGALVVVMGALLLFGLWAMFIASWLIAWWYFVIGFFAVCLFFTILSYVVEGM